MRSGIKVQQMLVRIDTMKPGTQFMFGGKRYLRVDGPSDFDTLPLIAWAVRHQERPHLRLAVHIESGELVPFFSDQQGEVRPDSERGGDGC